MTTIEGGCHCGRVRFRTTVDLAEALVCNCSLCAKKGFIHLIVPPDRFQLITGGDELSVYRFNTGVAQHQFCRHCGVHPFYVPRSDPDKVDVNARCLDGVDVEQLRPGRFDGKNWEDAQAARHAEQARRAGDAHPRPPAAMSPTCGQELAADAEVPDALAALMRHVGENLDAHARWVGRDTPDAAREHDALVEVARAYRAIGDAAAGAAARMRAMRELPGTPHDPARLDRAGFATWMREKIELQRAFAALILQHAGASEEALAQMGA